MVLPDFSIDNGSESDILLSEALDTLLQDCHEAIDLAEADQAKLALPAELTRFLDADLQGSDFVAAFYRLVDGYGNAKGDAPLKELILTLYRFLRSMPDYADFVSDKLEAYRQAATDFPGSSSATVLLEQLRLRLERCMTVLPELESMLGQVRFYVDRKKNDDMTTQYKDAFRILRDLHAGLSGGSFAYDDVYRISRPLAAISAPRGNKSDTPEKRIFTELFCQYVGEAVHTAAGGASQRKCLDAFQFEPMIACERPSESIEAELMTLFPMVRCLFAMILAVDIRYSEQKKQAGLIEFSDFEHLALAILRGQEAGSYYRSRISEIYIDEYQDTSSIQEAIISSITNDNCLMVGDVKQSIYRFRHARPQIFLDKHKAFGEAVGGVLFELNRNFRSQQGIVDTVNQWFSQLMSEAAGEIRYDDRHALVAGAEPVAIDEPAVRLLFLDLSGQSAEEPDYLSESDVPVDEGFEPDNDEPDSADSLQDFSRDQKEALMVAAEIRRLAASGTAFGDMAVLARTRQTLNQYTTVLTDQQIPVLEEAEQAFLDTPLLRLMEALIHLIDNRRQDIPLAAVMRSGLYHGGFTDDEMARIRLDARASGEKTVCYHEAVDWYSVHGGDEKLRVRLADFLKFVDDLREKEPVFRIGELLDLIFQQTGFRDRTARRPDGPAGVADLDRFKVFAEQYEQRTRRGVYAFARYIERLHDMEQKQPALPGEQVSQDAVRLLTMHRSKGLEFPVVFIVGTAYQLNIREKNQHLLLSEQLGIGPDFVDPDRQVLYPTPLKQAMFEALKARNRSEELRLLYVAMTRAMRLLYLTGCFKAGPSGDAAAVRMIHAARAAKGPTLPEHLVLAARSYQEWLLLALARNSQVNLSPLFGLIEEQPIEESLPEGVRISVSFHSLTDLTEPSTASEQTSVLSPDTEWPLDGQIMAIDEGPAAESAHIGEYEIRRVPADCFRSSLLLAERLPEGVDEPQLADQEQEAVNRQIETVILGEYPFPAAVQLPQKISVSELKRRAGQLPDEMDTEAGTSTIHGITQSITEWIDPTEQKMTASEIGTAAHQVFRFLDYQAMTEDPTMKGLERQLSSLQQHGILSDGAMTAIQPMLESYLAFFCSPLAKRLCLAEQRGQLYREMPFTIAIPAAEISAAPGVDPSDRILVQGMIDLWFREDDKAILVDFKTDRLSGRPEEREALLRSRYHVQTGYYARAISLATGLPVKEQLVYAMQDRRFIEMSVHEAASPDTGTRQ